MTQDTAERAAEMLATSRKSKYSKEEWFAAIDHAIVITNPEQKMPPLSGRLGADTQDKALEIIYGAIVTARSANDFNAISIIANPIRHIYYAKKH
jgi:hypothetical protein